MGDIVEKSGNVKKRRWPVYWIFVLIFGVVIVACELLFQIPALCDFYTQHIFPLGLNGYGRIMGLFPFSVGEALIVAALVFGLAEVVLSLLLIPLRKKEGYSRLVKNYSKGFLIFVLLAVWLMVMNCSALYGCSKLNVKGNQNREYGQEQVRIVRDYVVGRCNELSGKVLRDEDGNVRVEGDIDSGIRQAMRQLSKEYPRLKGYYPVTKPMWGSFFMYQSGYDGVYFPFSMEANYSTYVSEIRYPFVACHELAHLKGYIYEDEADFIAWLACVGSRDEQLQYAGYLGVLNYMENDYLQGVTEESDLSEIKVEEIVWQDASSYTPQTDEKLEEKEELIDTETMESIGEKFTETYMEYYDATPNYAEVTKLMLAYYDGILY